ncbi:MAG: RNA polymerase sigma factor [Proteobacteria bacterium]|nr:RNA polymerase sigma factor [Pseudomonadota bacterium]
MHTSSPRSAAPNDYASLSESELVALAAAGDAAAFEAIMRRHNRLLFRTARSILKDDAEAEDVLQEAWLHAWRALDTFRADARLSTWLVRIAANAALARTRRKSATIIPLEAAMTATESATQAALTEDAERQPERAAMRVQLRQLLEARIDLLPEAFRTVFLLRGVEELSVEEVAAALDIPEATVRTRFFRARSLLREGLASEVDHGMADVFSFDGARCDRIVAGVLARAAAEGLC